MLITTDISRIIVQENVEQYLKAIIYKYIYTSVCLTMITALPKKMESVCQTKIVGLICQVVETHRMWPYISAGRRKNIVPNEACREMSVTFLSKTRRGRSAATFGLMLRLRAISHTRTARFLALNPMQIRSHSLSTRKCSLFSMCCTWLQSIA